MQQALLLGILAYGVAYLIGQWVFPLFPRRVVLIPDDLWSLAGIVIAVSIASSMIGIAIKLEKTLLQPIREIYDICNTLDKNQLLSIGSAFKVNNCIMELCEGSIEPVFYKDIAHINKMLSVKLKKFCIGLYEQVSVTGIRLPL